MMLSAKPTHTSQRPRPAKKLAENILEIKWTMNLLFWHIKTATPTMDIQGSAKDYKFLSRISMFILFGYNLNKQLTDK